MTTLAFMTTETAYDRYAVAYRDWWGPVIAPAAVSLLDPIGAVASTNRSSMAGSTTWSTRTSLPSLTA